MNVRLKRQKSTCFKGRQKPAQIAKGGRRVGRPQMVGCKHLNPEKRKKIKIKNEKREKEEKNDFKARYGFKIK